MVHMPSTSAMSGARKRTRSIVAFWLTFPELGFQHASGQFFDCCSPRDQRPFHADIIVIFVPQLAARFPHRDFWLACIVNEASCFTAEFLPLWICQNYGGFDLRLGHGPILFEQPVFLLGPTI
jgi:hypothetical protein